MLMGRTPTKHFNLPKGMRARQRGANVYYYLDTGAKPRKELPLGKDYVLAVQRWAELAMRPVPTQAVITFAMLWQKFCKDYLPNLSASTQKDYTKCSKHLLKFFDGDNPAPLDAIRPAHVRQYLDQRGKQSKHRANHERRLLSLLFNLARDWDYTAQPNPCTGIKGFAEPPRRIYIADQIFEAVYQHACQPTRDALDLAYLTAQRPIDVINMYKTDIQDGALHVRQSKTGAMVRIAVTGQLKNVIERINTRKEQFKVFSLALVVDEYGKPLSQHAIYKRFVKAKELASQHHPTLANDIAQYQIRDLRAKAVTDKTHQGDIRQAQKLAGHASETMTQRYVRNKVGENVNPTK